MKEQSAKNKKLEAALRYAHRGWPVLPVHSVQNGRCTCGSDCEKAGKHPRTQHGINDATTDPDRVGLWWSEWPRANVAIATGHISRLLVLDVDRRHGGYKSLKETL